MRQLINNFNEHYLENYTPSWLICLDKSMNSFLDKLCPEFMSVQRKPHPHGNEYHSIADGDEGNTAMYRIKIQEGKERPKYANVKWASPSKFEGENLKMGRKYNNTSSLMCDILTARGGLCQWTLAFVSQWESYTCTSMVCMGNHSSISKIIGQRGAPGHILTVTWRVSHLD